MLFYYEMVQNNVWDTRISVIPIKRSRVLQNNAHAP